MRRALAIAAAMLLAACGTSPEDPRVSLPDDATVTYAFHDSSVPPPYHRSITLTVTQDEARIIVDSYGDVLADERVATPADVWTTLGATLPSVQDVSVAQPNEGCVGGTGIDLAVTSAQGNLVDLSPQFCGGSNDALEAPIRAWIAPARDLFPATDVLAPEGE